MDYMNLLAPWCANRQQQVLRVKTVQVAATLPWTEYYKYRYLHGIGVKLQRIPRHICGNAGSAIEQLVRAQRLISFMDTTGCRPIATEKCPELHKDITLLNLPDHVTYWYGPDVEPFVLIEPYTLSDELQEEIAARMLTALVMPHPGIYAGGNGKTTSVMLSSKSNAAFLQQMSFVDWSKPLCEVQDINWFEALNLGKERKS